VDEPPEHMVKVCGYLSCIAEGLVFGMFSRMRVFVLVL
jgi:hypothetical protein